MTEIELRAGKKPVSGPSLLRLADKPMARPTGWSPSDWAQKPSEKPLKPLSKD